MPDELFTLGELADLSGVEVRTLRSWIAQGVVPGPDSAGRNARYPSGALKRTRAAKAMRDVYGMSLTAIRQDLLVADEAKIETLAAMAGREAEPPVSRPPEGASAADYLRGLRATGVFGAAPAPAAASPPPPPAPRALAGPPGSSLARLAEALERLAGSRPARRKAKGEARVHIPITPDLELAVRGDVAPEEIARYEQIADLLRVLLTGGAEHE
jgi:DNA-binding transcriptional MerR regulator